MIIDPVTARWTGALFNLAKRQDALEAVQKDMQQLGAEVASGAVRHWLIAGKGTADERKAKLAPLLDTFHETTKNLVHLLFDRGRQEVLIGMPEAFRQRMMREEGVLEGIVESAHELGQAEIDSLAAALGKRLGKRVSLDSRLRPELIGGVRVIVASRMIDFSVQGRLETLRRKLIEAPLPVGAA